MTDINREIDLGNVVKLKSDSPKMVVNTITGSGLYWCRWYEPSTKRFRQEAFFKEELKVQK
jgi:uncharacterized protein YodC (DUF2158 family)